MICFCPPNCLLFPLKKGWKLVQPCWLKVGLRMRVFLSATWHYLGIHLGVHIEKVLGAYSIWLDWANLKSGGAERDGLQSRKLGCLKVSVDCRRKVGLWSVFILHDYFHLLNDTKASNVKIGGSGLLLQRIPDPTFSNGFYSLSLFYLSYQTSLFDFQMLYFEAFENIY